MFTKKYQKKIIKIAEKEKGGNRGTVAAALLIVCKAFRVGKMSRFFIHEETIKVIPKKIILKAVLAETMSCDFPALYKSGEKMKHF